MEVRMSFRAVIPHPPQIRTSQITEAFEDHLEMCWHVLMLTVDFNLLTAKRGQRRKIFDLGLLPNTELSKNYVQNIFDVDQARDLAHSLGSIAQFFCTQNDVLGCCGASQLSTIG
jgi:hypothetical protein